MKKNLILALMLSMFAACESEKEKNINPEFDTIVVRKTELIFPENKDSIPSVEFDIHFLYPETFKDKETQLQLQQAFQREILGKNYEKYTSAQEAVDAFAAHFLKNSKKDLSPADFENLDSALFNMYAYRTALGDTITCQNSALISITSFESSYMGGPHGMFATSHRSIDLATFQKIELKDIFTPGYEEKLNHIIQEKLLQGLRKNSENSTEEDPKSNFFEFEKIAANDNFLINKTGLEFTYIPYEISAYSLGEHHVKIPYKELDGLLKADFLDRYINKK